MKRLFLLALLTSACAARQVPPNIAAESGGPVLQPPAPNQFTFGPGDKFSVKVWRHEELDMTITIAPDGGFTFPLVGRVQAANHTYTEIVKILEEALSKYYTDASVAVNVEAVANQKVFVLGEVQSPTVLQIQNDLTIIEALARTGGISPDARTDNVLLIRGSLTEPKLYTIDVDAIYKQGDFSQLVYLQRGDIVVVPARTIVNVERYFRHIQGMLAPIVGGSVVYRNVITGGAQGASSALGD